MSNTQFVPRRAHMIGMVIFLLSLTILFTASLIAYVYIRVSNQQIPLGSIHLPRALWVSTMMMLASSYTMHRALVAIRREKQPLFRTYLTSTIVFATLFVLIQTPAMAQLYHQHAAAQKEWNLKQLDESVHLVVPKPNADINVDEAIPSSRSVPFYALVMVLILVHAMHVIGGMIALAIVAYNGYHGRYDHEHYTGVQNCVFYWHFLDAVWIIMFTVVGAFG